MAFSTSEHSVSKLLYRIGSAALIFLPKPEIAVALVLEKADAGAVLATTAVDIINAYFDREDTASILPENHAYGDLAAVDRARTSIAATPSARQSGPMPLHRRYDLHLECAVLIQ